MEEIYNSTHPEGKIHKSKAKPMEEWMRNVGSKGKQWGSGLT